MKITQSTALLLALFIGTQSCAVNDDKNKTPEQIALEQNNRENEKTYHQEVEALKKLGLSPSELDNDYNIDYPYTSLKTLDPDEKMNLEEGIPHLQKIVEAYKNIVRDNKGRENIVINNNGAITAIEYSQAEEMLKGFEATLADFESRLEAEPTVITLFSNFDELEKMGIDLKDYRNPSFRSYQDPVTKYQYIEDFKLETLSHLCESMSWADCKKSLTPAEVLSIDNAYLKTKALVEAVDTLKKNHPIVFKNKRYSSKEIHFSDESSVIALKKLELFLSKRARFQRLIDSLNQISQMGIEMIRLDSFEGHSFVLRNATLDKIKLSNPVHITKLETNEKALLRDLKTEAFIAVTEATNEIDILEQSQTDDSQESELIESLTASLKKKRNELKALILAIQLKLDLHEVTLEIEDGNYSRGALATIGYGKAVQMIDTILSESKRTLEEDPNTPMLRLSQDSLNHLIELQEKLKKKISK